MTENETTKIGRDLTVILGPPGTGKTTRLLDIIDGLLAEGVPSTSVAFVSFTRAACLEAVARVGKRFELSTEDLPWFHTLHATCMKLLPGRPKVMDRKAWGLFAYKYHFNLTEVSGNEEEPGELPQNTQDDKIRAAIGWGRHRCLDIDQTLRSVKLDVPAITSRKFYETLVAFKQETGYIDFEDMLELVKAQPDSKPQVRVAIIDEAQDLSPLLASVALHLFGDTDRVFVAGDDDQAIFEFQGAEPGWLMGMRERANTVQLLDRSWRIPLSVHTLAQRIISKNRVRVPKEYTSRPEPGAIMAVSTFKAALAAVERANGGTPPRSVFVLSRNWKAVDALRDQMLDLGLPFGVKKKCNSPLDINKRTQDQNVWVRGINCALALSRHQDIMPGDLVAMLENIPARVTEGKSLLPFGFKARVEELPKNVPVSRADLESRWDLKDLFSLLDAGGPIAVFLKPKSATPDMYPRLRKYFGGLLARYGHIPKPTWFLSSVHSIKGAEADVVILLADMGKMSYESLIGRDGATKAEAETRVAYVAVTRARNGLILVDPRETRWAYPYRQTARGLITDGITPVDVAALEPVETPKPRGPAPLPYLMPSGDLVIPFECDLRYRWWGGGQSMLETLEELHAPADVVARYDPEAIRCRM